MPYTLPSPYLSHSQKTAYYMCPELYRFRYIEKPFSEPQVGALVFGSAIHKAFEFNFLYKLSYGQDRPVDEVIATFLDQWGKCTGAQFDGDDSWQRHLTLGMTLVRTYMREVAPLLKPLYVEAAHTVDVGGLLFHGLIDLYTADHIIVDYKTASKMWSAGKATDTDQLTGYTLLMRDKLGRCAEGTQIHCLDKSNGRVEVLDGGVRGAGHIEEYVADLHYVAQSISSGVFYRKNRQNWLCQPGRCPYWSVCEGKR